MTLVKEAHNVSNSYLSRTRKRPIPGLDLQTGSWTLTVRRYGNNPAGPGASTLWSKHSEVPTLPAALKGQQVTVDETHGFLKRVQEGKFQGDIGGPFDMTKRYMYLGDGAQYLRSPVTWFGFWSDSEYIGSVLPCNPATLTYPTGVDRDLAPLGTEAIARCKPTNNVSNLATDLVEIYSQGLPHLWGTALCKERVHAAKAAGDEYLNNEFGWKPLVSDIRKAAYAVANAHRLLNSYEANSGKVVRRRYEFPIEQTKTIVNLGPTEGFVYSGWDPAFIDGFVFKPNLIKTSTFYRRTWFSGAFTYHLPVGYRSRNWLIRTVAQAGPLLGIELTPNTVWQVTPWTWAANWFSNAGDIVNNVSDWSTDGLVLKWGYIMEHTIREDTYTLDGPTRFKAGHPFARPISLFYERKRRLRATPFGFQLHWPDFSPRQLAITAALGLVRL